MFSCNEVIIILERRFKTLQVGTISDQPNLRKINARITGLMPSEFAGQPRWLDELKRRKARELRSFLLYVGPVVLKGLLRPEKYTHFFSLLTSTRILLDEDSNIPSVYSGYVERLLNYFVTNCMEYYGCAFTSYNTHNLLDLCDDFACV